MNTLPPIVLPLFGVLLYQSSEYRRTKSHVLCVLNLYNYGYAAELYYYMLYQYLNKWFTRYIRITDIQRKPQGMELVKRANL